MKDIREVEDFLREYGQAKNSIQEYRLALNEIEQKKQMEYDKALRAQVMKQDRVKGGEFCECVSETVVRLVDVYREREAKLLDYIRADYWRMAYIEDAVKAAGLSDVETQCIKMRYFEGLKAWQVATKIGYSISRERDYRRKALYKISNKYKTRRFSALIGGNVC